MDVREAIGLIGHETMSREAGVALVTVNTAKKNNKFQETPAGHKMMRVCRSHGLDVVGNGHIAAGTEDVGFSFVGRNTHFSALIDGLRDGETRHGLSDGSWSLIDLLTAAAHVAGVEAQLDLAVWTASGDHGEQLRALISSNKLNKINLIVDRSFATRQPLVCQEVQTHFGNDALRVWSSHAKFAVFRGGRQDLLLLFSANLNRNKRIENFSVIADARLVSEYSALVADVWAKQKPGEGFTVSTSGRKVTDEVLGTRATEGAVSGVEEPLLIRIKREELRKKSADAEKVERLNAEAAGRLVPLEDVAARHGLAGSHLRTTIDSVRRDLAATLCDGCREVGLGQYDAGFQAGIEAVRSALEGG